MRGVGRAGAGGGREGLLRPRPAPGRVAQSSLAKLGSMVRLGSRLGAKQCQKLNGGRTALPRHSPGAQQWTPGNGLTEMRPLQSLINDLDDPVRGGVDQHRTIIAQRVAMLGHAILAWHFVISDTARGLFVRGPNCPSAAMSWTPPLRNVAAEAWPR